MTYIQLMMGDIDDDDVHEYELRKIEKERTRVGEVELLWDKLDRRLRIGMKNWFYSSVLVYEIRSFVNTFPYSIESFNSSSHILYFLS